MNTITRVPNGFGVDYVVTYADGRTETFGSMKRARLFAGPDAEVK